MAEEAEGGVDLSPTSGSEQPAPHFLHDVIFHGKLKVSVSTRGVRGGVRRSGAATTCSEDRKEIVIWDMYYYYYYYIHKMDYFRLRATHNF